VKPIFNLADFRDEMRRRGVYKTMSPERARKKLPDGKPKYGESEMDRRVRITTTSRRVFFADIVQAAKARLSLLDNRKSTDRVECPWKRFPDHAQCERCKDGEIAVGALRQHYRAMLDDYAGLA
jgi:hypothetical protein